MSVATSAGQICCSNWNWIRSKPAIKGEIRTAQCLPRSLCRLFYCMYSRAAGTGTVFVLTAPSLVSRLADEHDVPPDAALGRARVDDVLLFDEAERNDVDQD